MVIIINPVGAELGPVQPQLFLQNVDSLYIKIETYLPRTKLSSYCPAKGNVPVLYKLVFILKNNILHIIEKIRADGLPSFKLIFDLSVKVE